MWKNKEKKISQEEEKNISSAEMTAYWRSLHPQLSQDPYSLQLASPEGIGKAKEFESKFAYPLVGRKVSVRAGFILKKATELLKTGKYDACISLASGFSLLTYCIAETLGGTAQMIKFYDSDLPHMIVEREKRIASLPQGILRSEILKRLKHLPADLENLYQNKSSFTELLPDCQNPLFIIEGVIYFLSDPCVDWIINSIASFPNAALIFDYWPQDGVDESACFKRVVDSLKDFIPESIKSFWDKDSIDALSDRFSHIEDQKIGNIENEMSAEISEAAQFNNQHLFFPVKFIIAHKDASDSLAIKL